MTGEEAPQRNSCAVLALSRGGCQLGRQLAQALGGDFFPCKGRLTTVFAQVWSQYQHIVCIMATGIVVRAIAPLLKDKYRDPALVVCDELGRFAISLLSGHLGGANALARRVAEASGGQAVLTTASDVLGHTALDLWCRDLHLIPAESTSLTRVMARLVDQGSIALWSRYPLPPLPHDIMVVEERAAADLIFDARTAAPSRATLLHPRALVFGIGCNRGTPAAAIAAAVGATCRTHHLAPQAIARLASIDLKKDEQGLCAYARQAGLLIDFFTSDELNRVEGLASSAAVLRATGAKGVAEPAALLSAGADSTLVVDKMKWTDVTTAVAEIRRPWGKPTKGNEEACGP
ncbi:cobalt-precorrin 5A hydrolase [Desulfobulbus alkaliphilus]|uniref:cobalt-precorrin 5A hydrolase n=1 Tax=Desulfobulbus alkaliphilus TaxID=869814 RepID=UPI0019666D62|nr:cobalamin biosynthesis protein [Desulfobulbus alkaliphilus]MBM9537055.1 cobalamin biosynthesis protein [Desulfobulbus alkaliphilus]